MFARFKVFLTKKITQIWQFSNYYHCFLLNRKLNFGKKLFLLLTAFIFDDYWKMKQVPVLLSNGEEKISDGSSTQVLVLEKYLGFYHTTYLVITLSGACKTFEKSWKRRESCRKERKTQLIMPQTHLMAETRYAQKFNFKYMIYHYKKWEIKYQTKNLQALLLTAYFCNEKLETKNSFRTPVPRL